MKSEHAVGYLKGRFCSLRGLRQQIDNAEDHSRALAWVKACLIIHSLVFNIEHGEEDPDYVEELIREGHAHAPNAYLANNDLDSEIAQETRGQARRTHLKEQLFASMGMDEDAYDELDM